MTVEDDAATVGGGDVVNDTDEGSLARTVRTKESEDAPTPYLDAHFIEGGVLVETLANLVCSE